MPVFGRGSPVVLATAGLLMVIVSLILSIDAYELAGNPGATFSCDVSAKVSCSTVAASWQAQLLGFPNAFLGLVFGTAIATVGASLVLGARLPRVFMLGVQATATVALVFAWWMFQQAFTVIGVLCPWCLVIQVTSTVTWAVLSRINVLNGALVLPERWHTSLERFVRSGSDWIALATCLVLFAALVVGKYGSSLLG